MANTDLEIILKARDEASAAVNKLNQALGDVQSTSNKTTSDFGKLASAFAVGNLAANVAGQAVGALKNALFGCVQEAQEAEKVQAQLQAVLVSTGGAAGITADQVNETSTALQAVTTYGDEAITSVQSLLLTFTKISGETMPQATETVLDLATAMGGDTKGAAIQLGKALNDPITGITALTRVGVTFTEKQKEQIQTLVESGKGMEAQQIILQELSKEFGGSARAAAETFDGRMQQLKNTLSNVQENIGKAMLPALQALFTGFNADADAALNATEDMQTFSRFMYGMVNVLKTVANNFEALFHVFVGFGSVIGDVGKLIFAFSKDVINNFKKTGEIGREVFGAIAKAAKGDFGGAMDQLKGALDFSGALQNTTAAFANVGKTAQSEMGKAAAAFGRGVMNMTEAIDQHFYKPVKDATAGAAGALAQTWDDAGGKASKSAEKMKEAISSFNDKVKEQQSSLADMISDFTKKAQDQLENYQGKVADINKDIAESKADFERESADATKSYNQEVLNLFIKQQDKIADLLERRKDLQDRVQTGEGTTKDSSDLAALNAELDKAQTDLKAFYKERADIEAAADAERNRSDLERLQAKFLEETTERQRQHDERMADLLVKLDEERMAYEKQKEELITDTIDKYVKLNEQVQKGWEKMIADTKIKVSEMKALESQVLAIKASIEAAKAAVSKSSSNAGNIPGRAAGGPVTSGMPYIVGEEGPELFVPAGSGRIIPNGGGSSGVNLTLNIGTVLGGSPDAVAREIGDLIIKRLQLNART